MWGSIDGRSLMGSYIFKDQTDSGATDSKCGDCRRTFLRSCHLKRHQGTIHSKEKPYCCSHSRKCFSQATGLKRHQQTHQNETEETAEETEGVPTDIYPSTECSFSFVAKLNLYKHLKRHHHGEYLKLVENRSFSALHTKEAIDKHDPPYEPPARLKRSTRSPNGSRGHPKKRPIGRHRGRPPKNKSPQQPIKNKVHEQSAESEQSTTDLDGSAVPQRANTDGVMPQELPTSSHICGECLRTFSHLHLLKSHDCIQQGDGPHGCSHCGLY
ncbi:hypothetical protein AOLI_G00041130 [Acnodon oligacanthus]